MLRLICCLAGLGCMFCLLAWDGCFLLGVWSALGCENDRLKVGFEFDFTW